MSLLQESLGSLDRKLIQGESDWLLNLSQTSSTEAPGPIQGKGTRQLGLDLPLMGRHEKFGGWVGAAGGGGGGAQSWREAGV